MSNKFSTQKVEEIKEIELEVLEREDNAVIVKVDGWRIRLYFDKGFELTSNKVLAKYTGDMKNVHSVRFQKLK